MTLGKLLALEQEWYCKMNEIFQKLLAILSFLGLYKIGYRGM